MLHSIATHSQDGLKGYFLKEDKLDETKLNAHTQKPKTSGDKVQQVLIQKTPREDWSHTSY